MAEPLAQADKFRTSIATDQHGRKWAVTNDRHAYRAIPRADGRGYTKELIDALVAPPAPFGWKPPYPELLPPMHPDIYVQSPDNPQGLTIGYDAWHGMATEAFGEYTQSIQVLATERYPSNAGEAIAAPPPDLLRMAGRRPLHPDFIIAMRQGNRWALGLSNPRTGEAYPVPAWATPLLDTVASLWRPKRDDAADAARFADEDDEEGALAQAVARFDEKYLDEEEAADPEALGGKRIPVTPPRNARGHFVKGAAA